MQHGAVPCSMAPSLAAWRRSLQHAPWSKELVGRSFIAKPSRCSHPLSAWRRTAPAAAAAAVTFLPLKGPGPADENILGAPPRHKHRRRLTGLACVTGAPPMSDRCLLTCNKSRRRSAAPWQAAAAGAAAAIAVVLPIERLERQAEALWDVRGV
uniref:Uncharacterized protein n=1 Tax=Chlamydomonas euryale TaxID=1486919 RepID=A0A7R9VZC9_9CHLO